MQGTITIANKLNRKDSTTGLDVWHKTIIKNAKWKTTKVETVVGTDVSMGVQYTILIPFSEKYMQYTDWKNSTNRENCYTMSQGDYIFLDEVDEEITPNNITSLRTAYKNRVCEVRSIEEVPYDYNVIGVKNQLKVSGI